MGRSALETVLAALALLGLATGADAALVAHWTFDATATDVAGGYNGVLMAGAAIDATDAKVGGGALLLSNAGDYVQLPAATTGAGLNITGPVSFAAWVKTTDAAGHILGGYFNGGAFDGYGWTYETTGSNYWSPASGWRSATGAVNDGAWHHMVTTVSGTTLSYYVDGLLKQTINTAAQPTSYTGVRAIGQVSTGNGGAGHQVIGRIDDLRIYNHALSPVEVYALADSSAQTGLGVPNFSFEQPALAGPGAFQAGIPGWTGTGAGVYYPSAGSDYDVPVPHGNQVAFGNGLGGGLPGTITSASVGTLSSDTLYILRLDVGERKVSPNPGYGVALAAGGTTLNQIGNANGTAPDTVPGQFVPVTLYATADFNAAPGAPLTISLTNTGTGGQVNWDNVRLTAVTGAKLPVANHSFEANVLADGASTASAAGWTITPSAGSFNPDAASFTQTLVPDGQNVAYAYSGGTLSQAVAGAVLMPGYQYVLMVDVGYRKNSAPGQFPPYAVELLAGGTALAPDPGTGVSLVPNNDQFLTSVTTFTTVHANSLVGLPLSIRLSHLASASSSQVIFDNVRLFAFQVPEPSSWALAGLGAVALAGFALRRRRN